MAQPLIFALSRIPTPIGTMLVATDERERLRVLDWQTHLDRMQRLLDRSYGPGCALLQEGQAARAVVDRLQAFFDGELAAIDGIPTEAAGTPFQRRVWSALREIPAGETWSYGRLARHVGSPAAVRAVGLANGANPIAIVVPCHRVIGANGALTGYGGGLQRKEWLLRHEKALFREAA